MADGSTIEQLNYEVILQDSSFKKDINELLGIAEKFNTNMTQALNLKKAYDSAPLKDIHGKTEKIVASTENLDRAQKKYASSVRETNSILNGTTGIMRTLAQLAGVAFGVEGVRRFMSSLVSVTGEFEVQKMALTSMLQDADKAEEIFTELRQNALNSPYTFQDLSKYAKQLTAFNIDADQLVETENRLADVAAGLGVDMGRIILAYGQVKAAGVLKGCLGIDTPVRTTEGIKKVQDIKVGDFLLNEKMEVVHVKELIRGRELMYRIIQSDGEDYRVNANHILTLYRDGGLHDVYVKDYDESYLGARYVAGKIITYPIKVVVDKVDDYYGFVLDGNKRFQLGDGTITHNTELRQFTEAGVPLLQSLAEQITETEGKAISLSEVFQRISKKEIPFEMVEEAFRRMTSEGGKFYNMQEVLVNTLQGKIGKLRDVWQQALYDIGTSQDSTLKGAVDTVTWLIQHMQWLGSVLIEVIKGFGAYAAVLLMVAARQKAMELGRFVAALLQTARGAKSLSAALKALNLTAKSAAGAIGALVTAGFLLFDLFRGLSEKSNAFNKELEEIHKNAGASGGYDTEIEKLRMLQDVMNDSTKSYAERNRALAEIKSIVPGYHAQLNEEGRLIKNNTTAVNEYIAALERSARQKKLDAELEQLLDLQDRSKAEVDEARAAANRADAARRTSYTGYGSITGAGDMVGALSEIRAAAANNRLKQAEENLKRVGDAITGVKNKMKDLLAEGFVVPNNDPTWTPLGDDNGQGIQKQIDALKEVQGYYETLKEFMSDEDIKKFFDSKGIKTNGFDFWTQILDKAKELEKVNPDAAARVFAEYNKFLVGNKVSDLKGQADAAQKWTETLRKWQKDWGGGNYHGIEGDIDKVIRDYNNEDEAITQDYLDSLNQIVEAHWGDADAINAEIAALDKLVAARRAANSTEQQEKLNDLANKNVKDKTRNLNLRDWGNKSIGQVREIYRALTELANGEVVLDETMTGRLQRAGLAIEDFSNLSKEEFEQLSENAKQELVKKFCNTLKEVVSDLNAVAGAVKDFADAAGNNGLSVAMQGLSFTMDSLGKFAEKAATGDWIGAIVGYAASLATAFFQARAEVARFEATLRAARETARMENMLGGLGADSIFGESGIRKLRDAVSVMRQARASMNSAAMPSTFNRKHTFWDELGMSGRRLSYTLAELAESVGRDLYDAYGNLNADTLKAILETYDDLGQAEQEWITRAINDSEAYAKSMEQMEGVLQDVIGNMASQATDKIVDSWIAAGDAALDYADILDDVARSYAKMITQSMLIDSVLTPEFKNELLTKFKNEDTEGAMALILGGMEQIQAMAPEIAAALEPLRPYIQTGGSGTDSLKDGINKELVEGNSSLIASYMNAMRADLSVLRQLQNAGWADVRLVRESIPTYTEYFARIEANTYDQAQATHAILAKLQGIIAPSSNGGSAVRTTK